MPAGPSPQGLSFVRNIIVARLISPQDFGIAATFAITMSLLEMISDLAADRLIIQAKDGEDPQLQATAQLWQFTRGLMLRPAHRRPGVAGGHAVRSAASPLGVLLAGARAAAARLRPPGHQAPAARHEIRPAGVERSRLAGVGHCGGVSGGLVDAQLRRRCCGW